ncbi:MAG TPA: SCO6880 family protein, partial [Acidimicrobiales bacterium]|nr:SCO6880 family protein [Acidimicrobiales bacterium]
RGGRLVDRLAHLAAPSAGPLALEVSWRHVRVDGAWHRTFWVAGWPRLAVGPCWLEPFLCGAGVTRTMTVLHVPVSAHQSRRRIERDLVRLESDASTKESQGRRVDARHQRATQALLERENEIVAGYAEVAYLGLVTVTAADEETLEEHSEIVEQLAREAGMELRVLDARQDTAWAAALPLGLAPAMAVTG